MPDPSLLEKALADAIAFAIDHGVDSTITPADFGIQRSEAGVTHATYVDSDHAVTVLSDRHGGTRFAVAELFWVHDESDAERDPCDYCGEGEGDPPMVDVYLPGDAPEAVPAHG